MVNLIGKRSVKTIPYPMPSAQECGTPCILIAMAVGCFICGLHGKSSVLLGRMIGLDRDKSYEVGVCPEAQPGPLAKGFSEPKVSGKWHKKAQWGHEITLRLTIATNAKNFTRLIKSDMYIAF